MPPPSPRLLLPLLNGILANLVGGIAVARSGGRRSVCVTGGHKTVGCDGMFLPKKFKSLPACGDPFKFRRLGKSYTTSDPSNSPTIKRTRAVPRTFWHARAISTQTEVQAREWCQQSKRFQKFLSAASCVCIATMRVTSCPNSLSACNDSDMVKLLFLSMVLADFL